MNNFILVALVSGKRKDGSGSWYRASLKGHNSQGHPVVRDFYLSEEVGEKLVKDGILEDCPVNVSFGFDEYMRPSIAGLTKATATSAKGGATV